MTGSAAAAVCAWCNGPIPGRARRDSICCSKRCRQARHRFLRAVGVAEAASSPMRLAYADPPYPGRAARYYAEHPDFAGEVDHGRLIASLAGFDGWALSTSADALQELLPLCPEGVRVAAWHHGERPNRGARGPLNAWEPVIFFGGRPTIHEDASRLASRDTSSSAERDVSVPASHDANRGGGRRIDSLVYVARARRTDPGRVIGSKPATFCRWVFDLLGAQAGDALVDLFPGSGGVSRAWGAFSGRG